MYASIVFYLWTIMPATITRSKPVPDFLIYEVLDGNNIYYKNYEEVTDNGKTLEEIMASSILQSTLITIILKFLFKQINDKEYFIASNEAGLHIAKGNNLANDIAIYSKTKHRIDHFSRNYFDFPPETVIEIDIKADIRDFVSPMDYIYKKTKKMHDFGVKTVIWITTESRLITLATPDAPITTYDWDENVKLFDDCIININTLLKEEGII